jgi:hypothetical protein
MSKRGEKTTYTADGDPKKPQTEKLADVGRRAEKVDQDRRLNDCRAHREGQPHHLPDQRQHDDRLIDDSPKASAKASSALQLHARLHDGHPVQGHSDDEKLD